MVVEPSSRRRLRAVLSPLAATAAASRSSSVSKHVLRTGMPSYDALRGGSSPPVPAVNSALSPAFDRLRTLGYAPPASDGTAVRVASGPAGRAPDVHESPGLGR